MALPIRTRKLIGTFILLAFIIVYAFVTMMLGLWVLKDAAGWQEALFYAITGCLWAFPAMIILRWMMKPDEPAN
ncbi:MAG: DUF2842 domain-containing protein [Hyphomicrobiales bacterium]|jgi:uncharacterized SAM-binding protein YcdF (DUF218 family)